MVTRNQVGGAAFTFYLDPTLPAQKELLEKILSMDEVETNTPIIGWFTSEVDGTRVASKHGCIVWAGDFAGSLTVHSAIPVTTPITQKRSTTQTLELEDKIYISFIISDGDNVQYDMNYLRNPLWSDPQRGEIPLGWTISPALARLAPAIAQWYYNTASTQDYFLAGGGGMGYIYPSLYPDLASFNTDSEQFMEEMDLNEIWLINLFDEGNRTTAQTMMNEMGLNAIFESTVGPRQPTVLLGGRPYLATPIDIWIGELSSKEKVRSLVNAIHGWSAGEERPCFIFVPAQAWGLDPSTLHQVASSLGSDYPVVRPDELIALAKVSLSENLSPLLLAVVLILLALIAAR